MVEKVTICKVLYDFDSTEPGEIALKEGQYIQLIGQVGKQTDGVFCRYSFLSFNSLHAQRHDLGKNWSVELTFNKKVAKIVLSLHFHESECYQRA